MKILSIPQTILPKGVNSINKRIKNPYFSNDRYFISRCTGKMVAKSFDPSRGGIGKRLKKAKTRLMETAKLKMFAKCGKNRLDPNRWKNIAAKTAKAKLAATPAIATTASPNLMLIKIILTQILVFFSNDV